MGRLGLGRPFYTRAASGAIYAPGAIQPATRPGPLSRATRESEHPWMRPRCENRLTYRSVGNTSERLLRLLLSQGEALPRVRVGAPDGGIMAPGEGDVKRKSVGEVMPQSRVAAGIFLRSECGLQPVPRPCDGLKAALQTGKASRRHPVLRHYPWTVDGRQWTVRKPRRSRLGRR